MFRWFWRWKVPDVSNVAVMLVSSSCASFALLVIAALDSFLATEHIRWWYILCGIAAYILGKIVAGFWMRVNSVRFGINKEVHARRSHEYRAFGLRYLIAAAPMGLCGGPVIRSMTEERPIDDFSIGVAVGVLLIVVATVFGSAPQPAETRASRAQAGDTAA